MGLSIWIVILPPLSTLWPPWDFDCGRGNSVGGRDPQGERGLAEEKGVEGRFPTIRGPSAGGAPPSALLGFLCPTCPRKGTAAAESLSGVPLNFRGVSPGKLLALATAVTAVRPLTWRR